MESKLTPILRFREYEHEWKAKTFKELGSVAMCKRIFKEQTTARGEIPFYKIGTFGKVADSYISRETYEEYKEKYIYPKVGDILLSASGTIGRTVIYDGEDAYFQDSNIIWFNAHQEPLDNSFLYQFYQVVKWSGLEGSTIKRLYNENVLSTNINLPSLDEQKKIGSFFKNLDDTISLHQQELEALKQTKQGFLQKMFPKDGESMPEIRFSNEIGYWEKVKLGKVAPLRGGYAFKSNLFCEKGIPIVRISNINSNGKIDGEFVYIQENPTYETYLLKNNSTLIAMSGATTGKVATIRNLSSKIYQNQRVGYFIKTDQIDYEFLSILVKSHFFKAKLKDLLVAGAQPNISSKDIDNLEFFIPTKSEEQVKIGEFFRQLDEVIELKEKELEAIKETKKGFLQKMFV